MRAISFSLTERQFLDGTKDVTRRQGWRRIKVGDKLRGVRKAMGLKKGEKQVVLGVIEVLEKDLVRLDTITKRDVIREGFPNMTPRQFVQMYCDNHKGCKPDSEVTRIVFRRIT
jgi:hypothetical protein